MPDTTIDLSGFSGGDDYYRVPLSRLVYTEGVK